MGRWKWLNLAVVAVAAWYGYLDVVVTDWNPYEPAFRAVGIVTYSTCSAELQTATHRRRTWYQLRVESTPCWTRVKRAWLVAGDRRLPFSGARHRFRTSLRPDDQLTPTPPLTVELERWDTTRDTAAVALKELR